MINIYLFTLSKHENSTYQPDTGAGTKETCEIKGGCSILSPSFIFRFSAAFVPSYNYCYVPEFKRYYAINNWLYNSGLWYCSAVVDVLASYKEEIGNQSLYVVRSTYNKNKSIYFDGNVVDSTYPATAKQVTFLSSAQSNPFNTIGCYVVGIINQEANSGSVSYYAFSEANFTTFCNKLYNYSAGGWLDIDVSEISENLQKALINPFQYITNCFYLPLSLDDIAGASTSTVYFGWWSVSDVPCKLVTTSSAYITGTISLSIPKHPQSTRGNWLNLNPYSYYTLRFFPFGTIDIDSDALAGWNTIECSYSVDVVTGSGILNLHVAGINNPIRTLSAQVGVQIPTASINVDYSQLGSTGVIAGAASAVSQLGSGSGGNWFENAASNIKNAISAASTGDWGSVAGGTGRAASNIASAAMSAEATVEITGQQGGISGYRSQNVTLSGRFIPIVDEDFEHRGRPLCKVMKISDLSGFIQCANAEIEIACTEIEQQGLRAYLENGFYYE